MVERWLAELTTKKIRRGTHTSVQALERDIRDWIDTWNEIPAPTSGSRPPSRSSPPWPATASGSRQERPRNEHITIYPSNQRLRILGLTPVLA
jgi:hypothetical protein